VRTESSFLLQQPLALAPNTIQLQAEAIHGHLLWPSRRERAFGRLPSLVWLITDSAPLLPVMALLAADLPVSADESALVPVSPPLLHAPGHIDLIALRSLPVDVPLLAAAAPAAAPSPAAPTGTPADQQNKVEAWIGLSSHLLPSRPPAHCKLRA